MEGRDHCSGAGGGGEETPSCRPRVRGHHGGTDQRGGGQEAGKEQAVEGWARWKIYSPRRSSWSPRRRNNNLSMQLRSGHASDLVTPSDQWQPRSTYPPSPGRGPGSDGGRRGEGQVPYPLHPWSSAGPGPSKLWQPPSVYRTGQQRRAWPWQRSEICVTRGWWTTGSGHSTWSQGGS